MVSEFVIDFHDCQWKITVRLGGRPGQAAAHLNVLIWPKQGRSLHPMSNFDKGLKMTRLLKHILFVCVCSFALTGHAIVKSPDTSAEPIAGSISDAERAYTEGNYEKAAKLYRTLAEQGSIEAQLVLGSLYETGIGVPQDKKEAARWYRLAAEKGNAKAQSKLGAIYDIGLDVPQDKNEAARWWRLAAEQGDDFAQLSLGSMYDRGKAFPRDFNEAVKWYRLAAEQGNAFAQEKLAWKYELGEGVPQDDVLAHMWFSIAASDKSAPGRIFAKKQRDAIATRMTEKQIGKARELAKKCIANRFRGC